MSLASKQELHAALLSTIAAELAVAERAYRATRQGATHEEAKPENDKDTRALEQSYLARGQAKRIEELRAGLAALERMPVDVFAEGAAVALGAVVELSEESGDTTVLVAPCGGGTKLRNGAVQVVTPQSPLGRGLLGKREGDACEVAERPARWSSFACCEDGAHASPKTRVSVDRTPDSRKAGRRCRWGGRRAAA
jgi:transcription elongation GreA/GreB family factor